MAEKDDIRARILAEIDRTIQQYASLGQPFIEHDILEDRRKDVIPGTKIAWCGDYVAYVLCRVGGSRPFINRKEVNGRIRWGETISMIVNAARRAGAADRSLGVPGDILLLDRPNGGHLCFLHSLRAEGRDYATADGNGPAGGIAINRRRGDDHPLLVLDVNRLLQPGVASANTSVFAVEAINRTLLRRGDRYVVKTPVPATTWSVAE